MLCGAQSLAPVAVSPLGGADMGWSAADTHWYLGKPWLCPRLDTVQYMLCCCPQLCLQTQRRRVRATW